MKGLNFMKFLSVNDVCSLWGVSQQFVRRLCREGRIPGAQQTEDGWLIPEDTDKPVRKERTQTTRKSPQPKTTLTPFAKKVVYQKERNNHYGIYEYIQLNLAYSSNRMASNRMTRNEIEEVYRTNKISTSFEPVKVDDIIEVINHFTAVRYLVDNITAPISQVLIKKLHRLLTYGTYADRKETIHSGEYRQQVADLGVAPKDINNKLAVLIREYEGHPVNMDRILDFHVRFVKIHPFEDYNGRVGRLIMMKECLRYGIDPFIIDDKRRAAYYRGINAWKGDPDQLRTVALEAQRRFQGKMEICKLFQYARSPGTE
jgi:fido (protein-threonine AMPylation protein)